jgi:glycopeptide antibiotics resistance protein
MKKTAIYSKTNNLMKVVFVIYLLVLIKLTIFRPYHFTSASINLVPFKTILMYLKGLLPLNIAVRNLAGNILVFLPMGMLLPAITNKLRSYKKIAICSVLLSLSIELTQLLLKVGSFDIDDLILNTLGGILGYTLVMIAVKLSR